MQRNVPESWRKLYDSCISGKANARRSIQMFCGECVGYIREEVTACSDTNCPLYHIRPFSGIKRRQPASKMG